MNFYKLNNLENLNLSNNFIKGYKNFEKLKNLKILVIKNNEIIEYEIFESKVIQKIYLKGNLI